MAKMWEVHEDNDGLFVELDSGEDTYIGRQDNLHLYTHPAAISEMDHLHYIMERKQKTVGMYMFRVAIQEFDELAVLLRAHDFYCIHKPRPDPRDLEVYMQYVIDKEEKPDWL